MICRICGKNIPEDLEKCPFCHTPMVSAKTVLQHKDAADKKGKVISNTNSFMGEDKTEFGILFCWIFGALGIIGLIIGLFLYPAGSSERASFIASWKYTFFVKLTLTIVLLFIYFIGNAIIIDKIAELIGDILR